MTHDTQDPEHPQRDAAVFGTVSENEPGPLRQAASDLVHCLASELEQEDPPVKGPLVSAWRKLRDLVHQQPPTMPAAQQTPGTFTIEELDLLREEVAAARQERNDAREFAVRLWDQGKPEDFVGRPLDGGQWHKIIDRWRDKATQQEKGPPTGTRLERDDARRAVVQLYDMLKGDRNCAFIQAGAIDRWRRDLFGTDLPQKSRLPLISMPGNEQKPSDVDRSDEAAVIYEQAREQIKAMRRTITDLRKHCAQASEHILQALKGISCPALDSQPEIVLLRDVGGDLKTYGVSDYRKSLDAFQSFHREAREARETGVPIITSKQKEPEWKRESRADLHQATLKLKLKLDESRKTAIHLFFGMEPSKAEKGMIKEWIEHGKNNKPCYLCDHCASNDQEAYWCTKHERGTDYDESCRDWDCTLITPQQQLDRSILAEAFDSTEAKPVKVSTNHDYTLKALKNLGVDTSCEACAAIAFTGSAPGLSHTCDQTKPTRRHLQDLRKQRDALACRLLYIEDDCYSYEPKTNGNGPEPPEGWRDWADPEPSQEQLNHEWELYKEWATEQGVQVEEALRVGTSKTCWYSKSGQRKAEREAKRAEHEPDCYCGAGFIQKDSPHYQHKPECPRYMKK